MEPNEVKNLTRQALSIDSNIRHDACRRLRDMGRDALSPMLKALESPEIETRTAALGAWEMLSDPRSVEPLIRLLIHWDERVRVGAVKALGHQRDARAIPALIDRLQDRSTAIPFAIVHALGYIGGPLAVKAIAETLTDENEDFRLLAIVSLGYCGGPTILPILRKALHDPSPAVRAKAIWRMQSAGAEAVPVLGAILHARDSEHSAIAAEALGNVGTMAALNVLITAVHDTRTSIREKIRSAILMTIHRSQGKDMTLVKPLALLLFDLQYQMNSTAQNALCQFYWEAHPQHDGSVPNALRGLPRDILATHQLTVPQKFEVLELLRRFPRPISFLSGFDVPSVELLCRKVLTEKDLDAHVGAREVLTWLARRNHASE